MKNYNNLKYKKESINNINTQQKDKITDEDIEKPVIFNVPIPLRGLMNKFN